MKNLQNFDHIQELDANVYGGAPKGPQICDLRRGTCTLLSISIIFR
jgi:hypothetical protein